MLLETQKTILNVKNHLSQFELEYTKIPSLDGSFDIAKSLYNIPSDDRLSLLNSNGITMNNQYTIVGPNLNKFLKDKKIDYDDSLKSKFPGINMDYLVKRLNILKDHSVKIFKKIIICNPFTKEINKRYITDFIYMNTDTYTTQLDHTTYKKLNECSQIPLIILPIFLYNSKYGHANFLLIDNKRHTIDYFEPHGIFNNQNEEYPLIIKNFINNKLPYTKEYSFNNTNIYMGLQQDDSFCGVWCLYVMWLIVMNNNSPDINISQRIKFYLLCQGYDNNIKELTQFIQLFDTIFTDIKSEELSTNVINTIRGIDENNINILPLIDNHVSFIDDDIKENTIELFKNIKSNDYEKLPDTLKKLSNISDYTFFGKVFFENINV
jgi:hypothetical protein